MSSKHDPDAHVTCPKLSEIEISSGRWRKDYSREDEHRIRAMEIREDK